MSLRSVLRVFAVIAVCLSSIGITPVAAQSADIPAEVNVTAARICEDNSAEIRWTPDTRMSDFSMAFSNSSDDWTSGWLEADPYALIFTHDVGHNFDKVAVKIWFWFFWDIEPQEFIIDTSLCAEGAADPNPTLHSLLVSGQVVDDAGTPIVGAQIQIANHSGTGIDIRTNTDANGYYVFSSVPNTGFTITFDSESDSPDFVYEMYSRSFGRQDGDLEVNAVLDRSPGGRPTGVLVDLNGNPIQGAELHCWNCGKEGSDNTNSRYPTTDEDGRFLWAYTLPVGRDLYYTGVQTHDCMNDEWPEGVPYNARFYDYGEFSVTTTGINDFGTIQLNCTLTSAPTTETPVVTPTETVPSTETPVATETPAVTPTETVPPTEVPTETVTPEGENTLVVTITLPDGASIEGAPYNLFAAQASVVFETEPYRSGVVGANNTIEIDDLLPGTYKLVISPEGMDPIEAVIEVGDQPLTEVRLTVNEDGSVTVGDIAQVTPTAPTEEEKSDEVTALPTTGTGGFNGSTGVLMMLGIAASALMMAGGLAVRQKRG